MKKKMLALVTGSRDCGMHSGVIYVIELKKDKRRQIRLFWQSHKCITRNDCYSVFLYLILCKLTLLCSWLFSIWPNTFYDTYL